VCTTLALCGLMAIALTGKKDSPPPIIADVVAGHNQLVDFDRSSGSTSIDDDKLFARKLIKEALEKRSALWVEGKDAEVALFEIIKEKNSRVDPVSDDDISVLVNKYPKNLRSFYGMEDSHKAMIVYDPLGNVCLAFISTQIASTIASPANVHRLGNCAIGFFHEWIRGFLVVAGAPRHRDMILHQLLTKDGSTKVTELLQDDGILPKEVKYKSHDEIGARANISQAEKGKKASKRVQVPLPCRTSEKGKKASKRVQVKPPCRTSDCHKNANVYLNDGTSKGYCFACAGQYAPELLSEKESALECSVDGCSHRYKVTVGVKRYCNKCNPDEKLKRRRKEEQTLYDAKRYQEKKAKLLT
jgi:hypothetical protein